MLSLLPIALKRVDRWMIFKMMTCRCSSYKGIYSTVSSDSFKSGIVGMFLLWGSKCVWEKPTQPCRNKYFPKLGNFFIGDIYKWKYKINLISSRVVALVIKSTIFYHIDQGKFTYCSSTVVHEIWKHFFRDSMHKLVN